MIIGHSERDVPVGVPDAGGLRHNGGMDNYPLPLSMRVIVRDWSSANHILFLGPERNVLVDSGYGGKVAETLALLKAPDALADRPLHWLINTHCHSDHMGGNAALRREYGCRVTIPVGEAPLIEQWDTLGLWLDYADQRAEPFVFDGTIAPGDILRLGGLEWRAVAAPGHDMEALMFYCPEEKLLISGDALWENGFGVVLPEPPGDFGRLRAARATLEAIAELDVALLIPGHGRPFTDVPAAVERAQRRVDAFFADEKRMARHVLKVMLVFSLLDRGRMALAELPEFMERVPCYRDYNRFFFRLPLAELAHILLDELERAHAVRREGEFLYPT